MMNERLIGAEASFSQKKGPRSRWVGRLSAATPKGAARIGSERVYLTGFFPGSELNARLFHRKARHGSEFPTVPVWCREAMRHFDM
jgi:hypothetical protein